MNKFITQISMVGGVYICKFLKLIALKIGRDVDRQWNYIMIAVFQANYAILQWFSY